MNENEKTVAQTAIIATAVTALGIYAMKEFSDISIEYEDEYASAGQEALKQFGDFFF